MNKQSESKLPLLLQQLKLRAMADLWDNLSQQADQKGWGSARFLELLCEHELQVRESRRFAKHLKEACLPKGKTFSTYDFSYVPKFNKTQILTIATGGEWIKNGDNILVFGPSGIGKSHLVSAIGAQLIEKGYRVLFSSTTNLIQQLQAARQSYSLPNALKKLDKYDCLILDDLGYTQKDSEETNVLFELISDRYETRSMIVTCNYPFSRWEGIFKDKTMAVAAIDRLVHHSIILEMNGESYRQSAAMKRAKSINQSKNKE